MKKSLIFIFFFVFISSLFSQPKKINFENLPELTSLSPYNDIFKEYISIVDDNYKLSTKSQSPLIIFFTYKATKDFSKLSQISARTNILYDTIATLNNLNEFTQNLEGKTILLPTVQGLFVSSSPKNNTQILLFEKYKSHFEDEGIISFSINDELFYFFSGLRFDSTERAFFTDSSMILPVKKDSFYISSKFGKRISPVTGTWKDHNGIDFACNEDTPVMAAKDGEVTYAGYDPTFGNCIIILHSDKKTTSVYAHLNTMKVKQGQKVFKGDVIALSGNTGKTTGPHLHFEIRTDGVAQNPEQFLPKIE